MGNRPSSPVRGAVPAEAGVKNVMPRSRRVPITTLRGDMAWNDSVVRRPSAEPSRIELENCRIRAAAFKVGGDEDRLGKGVGSWNGRGPEYRDVFPVQFVLHAA